jgi:hypothetical protein
MDYAKRIGLTEYEIEWLESVAGETGPGSKASRGILALHNGAKPKEVAESLQVSRQTVDYWIVAFLKNGRTAAGTFTGKRKPYVYREGVRPGPKGGKPRPKMKKCNRCKEVKPVEEFHLRNSEIVPRTNADYSGFCKPCNTIATREKGYARQLARLGRDELRRQTIAEIAQLTEKLTWLESHADPE